MSALYSLDEVTFTGTVTMNGAAIDEAAEFEVSASAATSIGAAQSNNVRIAGAATITVFDAVASGIVRRVRFTGVCTLTHNATSLVLPGGANITTAVGDSLVAESFGGGNWKVLFYQKATGLVPGLGTMAVQNANAVAVTGGTLDAVAITNSSFTADPGGLKVEDINGDTLSIATGALTTNRTFTIEPVDADRTLTISANVTVDQSVATSSTPQFVAVNVGHASDTTIARVAAGYISVEGNLVYRAGGTDVPVADGGTGASTAAGARTNLGLTMGTDVQAFDADLSALAALTPADNNFIIGDGTAWVAESGNTARTSLGVGTADNVQFATLALGGARTEGVIQISPGAAGAVTANANADDVVIEGAGATGASLLYPSAQSGNVYFTSVAKTGSFGARLLGDNNSASPRFQVYVDGSGDPSIEAKNGLASVMASGVVAQHD